MLVHDSVNARVVDNNDNHVFYTNELSCPDTVINTVVEMYNAANGQNVLGSDGCIDAYLLDEPECTQEDREIICEGIYDYLQNKFGGLEK